MIKKLLIVCDVEGTIFKTDGSEYKIEGSDYAPSMWQRITCELDHKEEAQKEELKTQHKWDSGEYEKYSDWVKDTAKIHQKYGLTRHRFYDNIIKKAEYMPGVEEFFKKLNRNKFIPILVSGGFEELAVRAADELGIERDNIYAACNYIFDGAGKMIDAYIRPNYSEGKLAYIKNEVNNHKLDFNRDWIFIGDSKSDALIAEKSPLSFAINAHKEMRKKAKKSINNFMEALGDIEKFYENNQRNQSEIQNNDQTDSEVIDKGNEIENLKEKIENLNDENAQLRKGLVPNKVEHIKSFAEHAYGKNILFSKKAEASLENKLNYKQKDIDNIFEHLEAINNWAKKMKGEITEEEFLQCDNSQKIESALSESTKNMMKEEYMVEGVLTDMKIKLRSLPNCDQPRIYFGWDKKRNKVLIGTMCEHEKTNKYRT